jgi:hypothetical protein
LARRFRFLVPLIAATALLVAACSSGSSSGAKGRPSTDARLEIVSPTPSQVTGPDITLKFNLTGATVVPPQQVSGPLRGDQGHIHVKLDGALVSMAYGTEQPLTGLTPGTHTVQAEFVAVDHQPFSDPPVSAVVFQVKS